MGKGFACSMRQNLTLVVWNALARAICTRTVTTECPSVGISAGPIDLVRYEVALRLPT